MLLFPTWKRLRNRVRRAVTRLPEWECVPEGWARQRADAGITGWNVPAVMEAYRAKLHAFRDSLAGAAPPAVSTSAGVHSTAPSIGEQNTNLAFAYALSLAARNRDSVSVLDWGGGIGLHYFLGKALLPVDVTLDYHCKEMPLVCSLGCQAVPEVCFHEDESCLDRSYDLILASSSFQYTEQWAELLARLAGAAGGYLYLARVPVVFSSPSFVVLQRAYTHGFDTEYLGWVFNRDELLDCARRAGLELAREFLFGYKPLTRGAPEQDETRGFLFRPKKS